MMVEDEVIQKEPAVKQIVEQAEADDDSEAIASNNHDENVDAI